MSYRVILFLCFSVLLALRLPLLGERELILVLFVRLFDLRLFGFVCFLFLLVSGKGCGSCVIVALPGLFTYLFLWLLMGRFRQCFSYLPATCTYFCFRRITWVIINRFSLNLGSALTLWRSGLGLLRSNFYFLFIFFFYFILFFFLSELSARHTSVFLFPGDN